MGSTWRWVISSIFFGVLAMLALQHDSHTHLVVTSAGSPDWSELHSSMEKMHQAMASMAASDDEDEDFGLSLENRDSSRQCNGVF